MFYKSILVKLVFIFPFLFLINGMSTEFAHRSGRHIYLPTGEKFLMRGINLGNWLVPEGYMFKLKNTNSPRLINTMLSELIGPAAARKFWKKYRDNYITQNDIRFLKKCGVNTIRVPFNYRLFTPEQHPEIMLDTGFEMLDRIITWAKAEQIWLILDMHCAPGGQTGDNIDDSWGWPWLFESKESQLRTAKIWQKIAERYANETIILGYDLLNEPVPHWESVQYLNEKVVPVYKMIVDEIRKADKNHLIFLGGARRNTNFTIFSAPFDNNVAYTFHKYWNEVNTESIQPFLDFRAKYDVPIWLGESGENNDGWIDSCTALMVQHEIGYVFWPYKKMDATSCMVTFKKPSGYDKIIEYAEKNRASFKDIRKKRLDPEFVHQILNEFLENCLFENCEMNSGYIKAMHLNFKP